MGDNQVAIRVYCDEDVRDEIKDYVEDNSTSSVSSWARRLMLAEVRGVNDDGGSADIDTDEIRGIVEDAVDPFFDEFDEVIGALDDIEELVENADPYKNIGDDALALLREVSWEEHEEGVTWEMGIEPANAEEAVLLKGSPASVATALDTSISAAENALKRLARQKPNVEYVNDAGTKRYYVIKNER
jgi:hypothetical protein